MGRGWLRPVHICFSLTFLFGACGRGDVCRIAKQPFTGCVYSTQDQVELALEFLVRIKASSTSNHDSEILTGKQGKAAFWRIDMKGVRKRIKQQEATNQKNG